MDAKKSEKIIKKSKSQARARSRTCAVLGCANGDYRLSKWKEEICEEHKIMSIQCDCDPPFQ